MAYYEGKLIPRDPQKASEWLLKAAKKNYAPAMFTLGKMLKVGDGVEKNTALGHQLIQSEPYRVCRRVNILRDYPDDKIKIYP